MSSNFQIREKWAEFATAKLEKLTVPPLRCVDVLQIAEIVRTAHQLWGTSYEEILTMPPSLRKAIIDIRPLLTGNLFDEWIKACGEVNSLNEQVILATTIERFIDLVELYSFHGKTCNNN